GAWVRVSDRNTRFFTLFWAGRIWSPAVIHSQDLEGRLLGLVWRSLGIKIHNQDLHGASVAFAAHERRGDGEVSADVTARAPVEIDRFWRQPTHGNGPSGC